MLTHRVPCPPDRGDRIRAYHLLKAIGEQHDVTLAAIADEPVTSATMDELQSMTQTLLIARARPMRRRAAAAQALLTGKAITPAAMLDPRLAQQIIDRHRDQPFDVVLSYCTGMVGYVRALRDAAGEMAFRHVLDLVDVDSQKWAGFAESARGPMRLVYAAEAQRLRAVEAGRVVQFDAVAVISEAEAVRYRETVTAEHEPVVVGNGVDTMRFYPTADGRQECPLQAHGDAGPPTIIFTGVMSYKPNIDAAVWFARQAMPRIRAAIPDVCFKIVGKSPAPAVIALGELPGVEVVGPVDNTADHLRKATIAVAPMKIAPGVQNKVLEAMACGLAVVCSTPAASGIDAKPGRHLLLADTAADTAAQCVRLLTHLSHRAEIGQDARQRVLDRYDWQAAVAPMLRLLNPIQQTSPTQPA